MICRRCKQDKPKTAFKSQRRNLSGREGTCRECVRLRELEATPKKASPQTPSLDDIRRQKQAINAQRFAELPGKSTAGDGPIDRVESRKVVRAIRAASGRPWTPSDEDAIHTTIDLYDEPEPVLDVDGQECKR